MADAAGMGGACPPGCANAHRTGLARYATPARVAGPVPSARCHARSMEAKSAVAGYACLGSA